jgi:predicted enzyme related to lactoylglutathione lyase
VFKESKAFSGVSVNDLAAANAFYGQTLGLAVEELPASLLLHVAGGNGTFIYPKDNHTPATYTILTFPVVDIEQAVDALQSTGITVEHYEHLTDEKGIARGLATNQGPDIAWFTDPAGNILSVLQQA